MKSWIQTMGLLVVLVAMVSGITFMLHHSFSPIGPGPGPDKQLIPRQVAIPLKVLEWPEGEGEFEINRERYHLFPFSNPEPVAVNVGFQSGNCACSYVDLCVLSPEETRRFLAWSGATHVLTGAMWQSLPVRYPSALLSHLWDNERLEQFCAQEPRWRRLEREGAGVPVPPGTVGAIRVGWKPEKENPIRLSADLWNQGQETPASPRGSQRLEVPLVFVPAVRIYPAVNSPPLEVNAGGSAETEYVSWSSTRLHYKLAPKPESQHPCIEVTVEPLTPQDKARYAELKARMVTGYIIRVRVHERRSDSEQLDLGPLRRKLEFVTDAESGLLSVGLSGTVRGAVTLEGSSDADRLALGFFRAPAGIKKPFSLVAAQPGVELMDEVIVEPPDLKHLTARLEKDKQASAAGLSQWTLTIQVEPNRAGPLPREAAVLLKIQGNPPRRIRIPVTGNAVN
jgi:hypothetical protein